MNRDQTGCTSVMRVLYTYYTHSPVVCEEPMEAAIVEKGTLRHSTYNMVQVHFHWVGGVTADSEL